MRGVTATVGMVGGADRRPRPFRRAVLVCALIVGAVLIGSPRGYGAEFEGRFLFDEDDMLGYEIVTDGDALEPI